METLAEPLTSDTVRQHLLDRAEAYIARRRSSLSFISQQAVADSKFLANVKKGDNFTIRNYQRVIDWLDAEEASDKERAA